MFFMNKRLIIFLLAAGLILSGFNKNNQKATVTPVPTQAPEIRILKPGEGPGVDLVARADKKAVTLKITDLTPDITKVEYELVYDTDGVQRGVLGILDVKSGQTEITKEILLASCSKNVCVFDKNVSKLFLTVKFTGDQEPAEFQKEFQL